MVAGGACGGGEIKCIVFLFTASDHIDCHHTDGPGQLTSVLR